MFGIKFAHNRIKQITTSGAGGGAITTTTYYAPAGLFEKFIRADGNIEYRHTLLSPDGSLGIYTINAYGPTNNAADLPVAAPPYTVPAIAAQQTKYWAKDHLGSPVAEYPYGATSIAQVTQLGFDAWGLRRKAQANNAANNGFVSVSEVDIDSYASPRGYTGHEHLDEVGLIHMNGRIYDPIIGRFLQVDPVIADPYNLQSYNAYSYVHNNPLSYTDPTGLSAWTEVRRPMAAIAVAAIVMYTGAFAVTGQLSLKLFAETASLTDRKSTRLNSSHSTLSRMPSSA